MPIPSLAALLPVALSAAFSAAPDDSLMRARIEARIGAVPGAVVSVAFRDLATGDSLIVRGGESFHAASTMKLPVMIELFRRIDAGALRADQGILLVNRFASIVDRSLYSLSPDDDSDSTLYRRTGDRVAVRDLVERMITHSSNLATNALIEVAGAEQVTSTARRLGARQTIVRRGVEDGKAFAAGLNNTTTAPDLAALLVALEQGRAATRASTDSMRAILLRQAFNAEIPAGLPRGTRVAHKTGQITGHLHDAAIVYPPARAPFVLVILTRGIADERVARALMADIARDVWAHAVGRGVAMLPSTSPAPRP